MKKETNNSANEKDKTKAKSRSRVARKCASNVTNTDDGNTKCGGKKDHEPKVNEKVGKSEVDIM